MLPLQFARYWWIAGIVLLVLVLAAMLMPAVWIFPTKRDFLAWFVNVDKWLHGIIFVFLAVWFSGQYRPQHYWRIGVGLILFGVLIEACQRLVTYRSADVFDIAADAGGIAIGLVIASAGLGGWSVWVENRLLGNKVKSAVD
jgi:glycopeptide antibiotics resistance protein